MAGVPVQGTGAGAKEPEQRPKQVVVVAVPVPLPPPAPGQPARDGEVGGNRKYKLERVVLLVL